MGCTLLPSTLLNAFPLVACVLLQGHFAKVMLCLAPLGFAAFITMSRVAAYKHDWSDVNAGFIIGMWSGFLAYLINYQK
jgi:membrane-associated phospholipid phosphatase